MLLYILVAADDDVLADAWAIALDVEAIGFRSETIGLGVNVALYFMYVLCIYVWNRYQ
jgi:hypothetical protein